MTDLSSSAPLHHCSWENIAGELFLEESEKLLSITAWPSNFNEHVVMANDFLHTSVACHEIHRDDSILIIPPAQHGCINSRSLMGWDQCNQTLRWRQLAASTKTQYVSLHQSTIKAFTWLCCLCDIKTHLVWQHYLVQHCRCWGWLVWWVVCWKGRNFKPGHLYQTLCMESAVGFTGGMQTSMW